MWQLNPAHSYYGRHVFTKHPGSQQTRAICGTVSLVHWTHRWGPKYTGDWLCANLNFGYTASPYASPCRLFNETPRHYLIHKAGDPPEFVLEQSASNATCQARFGKNAWCSHDAQAFFEGDFRPVKPLACIIHGE